MSIAAGTYRAQAVKGSEQYGRTQAGDEKMTVDVELLDIGEHATVFLTFGEKAQRYSMARLKEMGWDGTDSMVGLGSREFTARVKYETYNGEERMRVDVIVPGSGGIPDKDRLGERETRTFLAKLSGKTVGNGLF